MTCQLYRCFDKRMRLLWVGISISTIVRYSQHKSKSPWAHLVTRIDVEHFPSREKALIAEQQAIKNEKPLYNIDGQEYSYEAYCAAVERRWKAREIREARRLRAWQQRQKL